MLPSFTLKGYKGIYNHNKVKSIRLPFTGKLTAKIDPCRETLTDCLKYFNLARVTKS